MATGGYYFSQMGIYTAAPNAPKSQVMPGGGTDNTKYAALDPTTKQPIQNGARNVWVTETALTTALNTAYMADRLALFGIVTGVALLLTGIGFAILSLAGALRSRELGFGFAHDKKRRRAPRLSPPDTRNTIGSSHRGRHPPAPNPFSARGFPVGSRGSTPLDHPDWVEHLGSKTLEPTGPTSESHARTPWNVTSVQVAAKSTSRPSAARVLACWVPPRRAPLGAPPG